MDSYSVTDVTPRDQLKTKDCHNYRPFTTEAISIDNKHTFNLEVVERFDFRSRNWLHFESLEGTVGSEDKPSRSPILDVFTWGNQVMGEYE